MLKYLTLPNPTLQKWRTWLKEQFIGEVPLEDAFCEFECEKSQCQLGHWATCKRRLAFLELGKMCPGDARELFEADQNGAAVESNVVPPLLLAPTARYAFVPHQTSLRPHR